MREEVPSDIKEIEKNIVSLKALVDDHPVIKELDINQLFAHEAGKKIMAADIITRLDDTTKHMDGGCKNA